MLQVTIDWLVYDVFGLSSATRVGQFLNYFIYDSIKILILLFAMITAIGFLRTYIPQKKMRDYLKGGRMGIGNIFASIFGAITPFCSCSSIPIFMGFMGAGVPLGVAFSFLITSPIVNEYLVVLMLAFFGWKITATYVVGGVLIGIAAGIILGRMGLEKHITKDILSRRNLDKKDKAYKNFKERALFGLSEAKSITKKLWFWILVGVAVGALIHNFIPEELIQNAISRTGIFTVPIATLIGVPMYGSCAAIVPIAVALFQKGVPIGTALSFMMAVSALSLPEAIILRRVMNLKLIGIFFGIVALAIILTGYLFNILQGILV